MLMGQTYQPKVQKDLMQSNVGVGRIFSIIVMGVCDPNLKFTNWVSIG